MVDDQLPASHYVSNIRENYPEIFEWLPTIDINSTIITVLMITVSIMAMISTLLILILEKTTFIGILKAMGMNNLQLRKIFIYHSVFIILQGMMYGNLIGIGLCWIQKKWGLIKLDIESYYLSEVPIHLDLIHIISLNVLTFLICIIALLVPSYLVSRISPVKAIRMD
jgi:lipoprotein-releasing system permease protein